jgi:hypothetical protein
MVGPERVTLGGRMKSEFSFNPIANISTDMSNSNCNTGPLQRSDLVVPLHSDDEDPYSSNSTAAPPHDHPDFQQPERWTVPIAILPGKSLGLEISFLVLGQDKVPARSHDTCQPTTDDHQFLALNSTERQA